MHSFSLKRSLYVSARDTPHAKPSTYNIPERAGVVRLVHSPGEVLTDRQRFLRTPCGESRLSRSERRYAQAQRRDQPKVIIKPEESESVVDNSNEGMNGVSHVIPAHLMPVLPGERKPTLPLSGLRILQTPPR